MSSSHVSSHRRKHKPPKRSEEEGHESENICLLKNKRKSYIAGITKLINSITELIDQKGSFSDFSKFDKSLESHIQNIRDLTTKITGSESEDNVVQRGLEMCAEPNVVTTPSLLSLCQNRHQSHHLAHVILIFQFSRDVKLQNKRTF